MPDVERYENPCDWKWRGREASDVDHAQAGHQTAVVERNENTSRILSKHRLLAQQERDSQRQSELVRPARRGIPYSKWTMQQPA